jgi:putative ABC transport system permease protein
MSIWRQLSYGISSLLNRRTKDRDVADEVQQYLDEATAAWMERGLSAEDAKLAARREIGTTTAIHEQVSSYGWENTVRSLTDDLRYTVRQLRRSAGFTLAAVLILAIGIGASTAIFSIVEGVLLRPLPFPQSDRIVAITDMLYGVTPDGSSVDAGVTVQDFHNYTRYAQSFAALGAFKPTTFQLSGASDAAFVHSARISSSVFSVLGTSPVLGRVFTQQEDEQRQRVAVLSYATWVSRFQADERIIGTKIYLERDPYIIIGVMPRSFEFPLVPGHLGRSELWVPLSLSQHELGQVGSWNLNMIGRLKPEVSLGQAQDDAERVAQETMRNYPASLRNIRIGVRIRSLKEDAVVEARSLLHILFLAVVVVLAIACANLAGLLLIRAIRRRKELAVRLALGAPAIALVRQAMLESLTLSIAGGIAGLGLAALSIQVGISLVPETIPRINEIGLDARVAGFSLLLAIITGLVCGIAPAFAAMHTGVNSALKDGGHTGSMSGGQGRLRSTLVVAEIAVAMVLVTASGLLLRSFQQERAVNLGFLPDHTLTGSYGLPEKQYGTQVAIDGFDDGLLRRLRQLPGVDAVGIASLLPASGEKDNSGFVIEGGVHANGSTLFGAWPSQILGDYFQAMGIPLVRGRVFNEDDTMTSQLVAIVNRKLAEQSWPGQNPIGRRLRWGTQTSKTPWMTVIGEVEDVKQSTPDGETMMQIYQPWSQNNLSYGEFVSPTDLMANYGNIVLRTGLPPEQMQSALLATVRSIDPQLPLNNVQTMEHAVSETEAPRWFNTALISFFAIDALLLAALGIYSVIAFSVTLREQEMAIRMALGAQRSGILHLVLSSGVKLASLGCVIGLIGAMTTSHLLRAFLFKVSPFDPVVLMLSVATMLLLALAASALPAGRAAKTNPVQALRGE